MSIECCRARTRRHMPHQHKRSGTLSLPPIAPPHRRPGQWCSTYSVFGQVCTLRRTSLRRKHWRIPTAQTRGQEPNRTEGGCSKRIRKRQVYTLRRMHRRGKHTDIRYDHPTERRCHIRFARLSTRILSHQVCIRRSKHLRRSPSSWVAAIHSCRHHRIRESFPGWTRDRRKVFLVQPTFHLRSDRPARNLSLPAL